jgi:hypothetical protein
MGKGRRNKVLKLTPAKVKYILVFSEELSRTFASFGFDPSSILHRLLRYAVMATKIIVKEDIDKYLVKPGTPRSCSSIPGP